MTDFIEGKMEDFWQTFEKSNDRYAIALHVYPKIKEWLSQALTQAYDEGYAARGGVESEQKQRMYEAGRSTMRSEVISLIPEQVHEYQHGVPEGEEFDYGVEYGRNQIISQVKKGIENIK